MRTTIVIRIIISIVLLFSAVGKIISPHEAEKTLILIFKLNIEPNELTKTVIIFISILEFALLLLFSAYKNKYYPILILLLFILFTVALISLPIRGIDIPNCGCFGSIISGGNLLSAIVKNVFFIILTIIYIHESNKGAHKI